MKKGIIFRALASAALVAAPLTAASAQVMWTPGSEIVGQTIQVETNGVTNTVVLDPGGSARITSPGGTVVPATWSVAGNQLCLTTATNQDCWTYAAPFQAGAPVTLINQCQVSSRWTALGTNVPPPPVQQAPVGERG